MLTLMIFSVKLFQKDSIPIPLKNGIIQIKDTSFILLIYPLQSTWLSSIP